MSTRPRILIVDDEEDMRWVLGGLFREAGFRVVEAENGEEALARIGEEAPHILLTDILMPGMDGIELIRRARQALPALPAVVLSAVDQVDTAVAAMKEGACDYMVKPFDNDRLVDLVGKQLAAARGPAGGEGGRGPIDLGVSPAAQALTREVERVAPTDLTVLLEGPSGTGKEYLARKMHEISPRAEGPFVAVDCGALPESLAESLLFGHRRGAFTGADQNRKGLFTAADGGTLFLDEIGNLPRPIQPKLLRALQERCLVPLGEERPVVFDARILCATNSDLQAMARADSFRTDLLHRINEYHLVIPPLSQRPEDIAYFAEKFLAQESPGGEAGRLGAEGLRSLAEAPWPGNLRELRNTIRRALVLAGAGPIRVEHLARPEGRTDAPGFPGRQSLTDEVRTAAENLEREWIRQALEQAGGNKAEAARMLKIDYTTLHRKLKKLDLEVDWKSGS